MGSEQETCHATKLKLVPSHCVQVLKIHVYRRKCRLSCFCQISSPCLPSGEEGREELGEGSVTTFLHLSTEGSVFLPRISQVGNPRKGGSAQVPRHGRPPGFVARCDEKEVVPPPGTRLGLTTRWEGCTWEWARGRLAQ